MPIQERNSKGEPGLSLSRSQMTPKKNRKRIQVFPCVCSVCGEKATVQPQT